MCGCGQSLSLAGEELGLIAVTLGTWSNCPVEYLQRLTLILNDDAAGRRTQISLLTCYTWFASTGSIFATLQHPYTHFWFK